MWMSVKKSDLCRSAGWWEGFVRNSVSFICDVRIFACIEMISFSFVNVGLMAGVFFFWC